MVSCCLGVKERLLQMAGGVKNSLGPNKAVEGWGEGNGSTGAQGMKRGKTRQSLKLPYHSSDLSDPLSIYSALNQPQPQG